MSTLHRSPSGRFTFLNATECVTEDLLAMFAHIETGLRTWTKQTPLPGLVVFVSKADESAWEPHAQHPLPAHGFGPGSYADAIGLVVVDELPYRNTAAFGLASVLRPPCLPDAWVERLYYFLVRRYTVRGYSADHFYRPCERRFRVGVRFSDPRVAAEKQAAFQCFIDLRQRVFKALQELRVCENHIVYGGWHRGVRARIEIIDALSLSLGFDSAIQARLAEVERTRAELEDALSRWGDLDVSRQASTGLPGPG
jgi:hypothetical protein